MGISLQFVERDKELLSKLIFVFLEGSICHNAWVDITDDFPSGLWKHYWPNPEAQSFAQNGSTGAYLSDIIAQIQKMEPNQEFKLHWISCREADKGSWWNIQPNQVKEIIYNTK